MLASAALACFLNLFLQKWRYLHNVIINDDDDIVQISPSPFIVIMNSNNSSSSSSWQESESLRDVMDK